MHLVLCSTREDNAKNYSLMNNKYLLLVYKKQEVLHVWLFMFSLCVAFFFFFSVSSTGACWPNRPQVKLARNQLFSLFSVSLNRGADMWPVCLLSHSEDIGTMILDQSPFALRNKRGQHSSFYCLFVKRCIIKLCWYFLLPEAASMQKLPIQL